MLIFDKGFMHLKNEYIVPLTQYSIEYKRLEKVNLKSALCTSIKSITDNSNKNFDVYFNDDAILPAILGDTYMCLIRAVLQWDATQKTYSLQPDFCPNWSIVTDYYYAYYISCTLLRLNHRGTLFFDNSFKKSLDKIFTELTGDSVALSSKYCFTISKNELATSEYKLSLKQTTLGTHEIIWKEISQLINSLINYTSINSDEYTCLTCISQMNKTLGDTFPSQIRNNVNYQLSYGIKAVDKKIFPAKAGNVEDNWLSPIIEYSPKKNIDEQYSIRLFSAYCKFLHILTFKLIEEYNDIRGRKNGIWSSFNKNRSHKIDFPSYPYSF